MSKKIEHEDFLEQVNSGKLLSDSQRLYSHIRKHPGITVNNLSRGTRIVLQTTAARVCDMMDKGIVEVIAKQKTIGQVKVTSDAMLQVQENPDKIMENRRARSDKKFKRAVSALLAFDEHLAPDMRDALQQLVKPAKP